MNINMTIKFSCRDPLAPCLCFKHAVEFSMRGYDVETDIDDFSSEYYMGPTYCVVCSASSEYDALKEILRGNK